MWSANNGLRGQACGCLIAKGRHCPVPGHCSLSERVSPGRLAAGMQWVEWRLPCATLRAGRPCHHMPDSRLKLTAPVGCADEDVVCQAWQVVQVNCISRVDAQGAPRHAQAEVHPLHGAGLDQLEAVDLASLQSQRGESASSGRAGLGPPGQGGPCQPAAGQSTACAWLQQPLVIRWSTVWGLQQGGHVSQAGVLGSTEQGTHLMGPAQQQQPGLGSGASNHHLTDNDAADRAASSPACRCGAGTCR